MNMIPVWNQETADWRASRIAIRAKWLYREETGDPWPSALTRDIEAHYFSRAERQLTEEGAIIGLTAFSSLRSDIELVIDAERLRGERPDPDRIALKVQQHHQTSNLWEVRDLVLDVLGDAAATPASRDI